MVKMVHARQSTNMMCTCICMRLCVCAYACMHACMLICVSACVCVCVCVCHCVRVYILYIHTVHVHVRTRTHTHTHTLYLVFGAWQSEPYSCTCIPKKHTSTPSISSKANRALVLKGNWSGKSPMNRSFIRHLVSRTLSLDDTTRMVT